MKVEKIKVSKIDQIDFDNLNFGSVFTDHMFSCDLFGNFLVILYFNGDCLENEKFFGEIFWIF